MNPRKNASNAIARSSGFAAEPSAGGGPSYEQTLCNLRCLRDFAGGFHVGIRVNCSPANLSAMPAFVQFLGAEFGNDSRYSIRFRPVGHWGAHEIIRSATTEASERNEVGLMKLASECGFRLSTWQENVQPLGSVCYAASPNHFVVGSDGNVYKCTVVFEDPWDQAGRLERDGNLDLFGEKEIFGRAQARKQTLNVKAALSDRLAKGTFVPLSSWITNPSAAPQRKQTSIRSFQSSRPTLGERQALLSDFGGHTTNTRPSYGRNRPKWS